MTSNDPSRDPNFAQVHPKFEISLMLFYKIAMFWFPYKKAKKNKLFFVVKFEHLSGTISKTIHKMFTFTH